MTIHIYYIYIKMIDAALALKYFNNDSAKKVRKNLIVY